MTIRVGALRDGDSPAIGEWIVERLRAAVASAPAAAGGMGSIELCENAHAAADRATPDEALRSALLAGDLEIAVLRCDAVIAQRESELEIVAFPHRDEPWEAWASLRYPDLVDLPEGARVAGGTRLRGAQLLHSRPDLELASLDRLGADPLAESDARGDAGIVLAAADLRRAGRADRIRAHFTTSEFTPRAGQGALALAVRPGDDRSAAIARSIDDPGTRAEIAAERAFLAALGLEGDLSVGALARRHGQTLLLVGVVASLDGERLVRLGSEGPLSEPAALGERLAAIVLRAGGQEVVDDLRAMSIRNKET